MNIEELYRTYFDIVYRYIRSISQDGSLAEEVTQETFFKALKKADQFRGDCDVRVWLCQIAKNTLYDHLKKRYRKSFKISSDIFIPAFLLAQTKCPV